MTSINVLDLVSTTSAEENDRIILSEKQKLRHSMTTEVRIKLEDHYRSLFRPIVKAELVEKYQDEIKKRIKKELTDNNARSIIKELEVNARYELISDVRAELKDKYLEEVNLRVKQELTNTNTRSIIKELEINARNELISVVIAELRAKYREEVNERVKRELSTSLTPDVISNLEKELKKVLQSTVKEELQAKYHDSVESRVKENIKNEVKKRAEDIHFQTVKASQEKMSEEKWIADIKNIVKINNFKFLSNGVLVDLLSNATKEEKLDLTLLLDDKQHKNYNTLDFQRNICHQGGHNVANLYRGQGTGYLDILNDIAEKLEIKGLTPYQGAVNELSVSDFDEVSSLKTEQGIGILLGKEYAERAEEKITLKLLEITYEKMSPEEKCVFDKRINEVAQKYGSDPTKKLAGSAGLVILGNLGGFATYTLLTTTMSAISMGTLSFGVYTTATSALSVVLGPIGWVGLGAAAVYAYGKPKYEKMIPLVVTLGAIRQRIKQEGIRASNETSDISYI